MPTQIAERKVSALELFFDLVFVGLAVVTVIAVVGATAPAPRTASEEPRDGRGTRTP